MSTLRRYLIVATLAGCAGFCLASATAFAYAKLNVWRAYGENFQLGYIVGYLDAVALVKRHDIRGFVPAQSRPKYEYWMKLVNEFFADPANARRPIADGMQAAGTRIQKEDIKRYQDRRWEALQKKLNAEPSPGAQVEPSPVADAPRGDDAAASE